jgi:hypothetical protein
MAEIGIDLDGAHPKLLTTDAVQASDVVVTMGCGDTCPIYPGKRYSTGTCPTLPTRPSPRSGLSGTRSTSASANCLRNSTSDVTHLASHACLRIESIEHKPLSDRLAAWFASAEDGSPPGGRIGAEHARRRKRGRAPQCDDP